MSAPVLVVEDDLSFREALRRWLNALGYACVLTESAEQAAQEFPKQPLSAVILDLNLPGRSGHVFLRQLRGIGAVTPVIVISGGAQMEDVILAMRNGAADFLRKPFRIDEIGTALERALRSASSGDSSTGLRIGPMIADAPTRPHAAVAAQDTTKTNPQPQRSRLSQLLDRIRTGNAALPVLDSQVGRISRLLSSSDVDLEELQSLVDSDANFSATVLRAANSAYYARGMPAKTIRDAFTRLGSRSVLNVITGAALQTRLRVRGPLASVARSQWINSIVTSRFCGEIAKALRRSDGERLQLLGLMHNIGEPLFIHLASELDLGADTDAVVAEMPAIHEAAGLALVRAWKMPPDICRIVGLHHARDAGTDFDFENERFIVLAAWHLALKCGFTYGPNQSGEPAEALAELGLTEAALGNICAEAKQWTFD